MTNITVANAQWASRPADERFLTLEELATFVSTRNALSTDVDVQYRDLRVMAVPDSNDLMLTAPTLAAPVGFTHFSFDKLAEYCSAPTGHLRRMAARGSTRLAAELYNESLEHQETWAGETMAVYVHDGSQLRTMTSTKFGRIFDSDAVAAVQSINADGRWSVPLKAYGGVNSTEATTLYASDRDIFIFMVDEARPIEVDAQTFYRGFYVYNSELGDKKFGLSTFLYERVCANRIIWGARDIKGIEIKHIENAPLRFMEEARPVLAALAGASSEPVEYMLRKARNFEVAETADSAEAWLRDRGFGVKEARSAVLLAGTGAEGTTGNPTSLLSLVEAGTAACRSIENTDKRLGQEARWSNLLARAR